MARVRRRVANATPKSRLDLRDVLPDWHWRNGPDFEIWGGHIQRYVPPERWKEFDRPWCSLSVESDVVGDLGDGGFFPLLGDGELVERVVEGGVAGFVGVGSEQVVCFSDGVMISPSV